MMKVVFLTLLALVQGAELEVTPVQKVIGLLQGMLEKGKKEKHDEEESFADFKMFCDSVLARKKAAINDETENIEHFTADIRKERAMAHIMAMDMQQLDYYINAWTGDINAATKVREQD